MVTERRRSQFENSLLAARPAKADPAVGDSTTDAEVSVNGLRHQVHSVEHAASGLHAPDLPSREEYDAFVLDRSLPPLDRLSVRRSLRISFRKRPDFQQTKSQAQGQPMARASMLRCTSLVPE